MRTRLSIALAAGLVAVVSAPAEAARAADEIVARDTVISAIYPLGGDLVYSRGTRRGLPQRVWMARFQGDVHRARGVPRQALRGDIGRDGKGRKVFTFGVAHRNTTKWFVYDLARNRTRRLHGLPAACFYVRWAAIWRGSLAYTAACKGKTGSGLFVSDGTRTRHLSTDPGGDQLRFRGGSLAVIFDDGADDFWVKQWMANGEVCDRRIDPSFGDATSEQYGWFPSGLWIANGYLTWTMGSPHGRGDFAILAAKVPAGCDTPGPVGMFPFTYDTSSPHAVAVDTGRVYYADGNTLRTEPLPATPSFDPPPNDDFKHAQEIAGDVPLSATGRVAYATVEPGEPLADTQHTIWYAYRPTSSRMVDVILTGACSSATESCYRAFRYGVYTGTSPDALTEIPPAGEYYTRFQAEAGRTYWIAVGKALPEPYHEPVTVRVEPALQT
jgi:hypothetical protein